MAAIIVVLALAVTIYRKHSNLSQAE